MKLVSLAYPYMLLGTIFSAPLRIRYLQLDANNPDSLHQLTCHSTHVTFIFIPQYWAFSDIQTGRVLTKVTDESAGCGK